MTMHDSDIGTRRDDMPAHPYAARTTDEHDDVTAPHGTARGHRLRNWLILGNLMGWILIIFLARRLFS
jgi:hypothetical protein